MKSRKWLLLLVVNAALVGAKTALAADLARTAPPKTPGAPPAYDWNGLYFGGHAGFGRGFSNAALGSQTTAFGDNRFGGLIGGAQAGYNYVLPSNVLLGLEADVSFQNTLESNSVISALASGPNSVVEKMDFLTTARGRIGYVSPPWLVYGTGGPAWTQRRFLDAFVLGSDQKLLRLGAGVAFGAGAEYAFAPSWALRLEYLHSHFGTEQVTFASGAHYSSTTDFETLRLGLTRQLAWPDAGSKPPGDTMAGANWELHGQTTYVQQGYPAFRAPYSGPNSLMPWPQTRETWTASAFLGVRAWDGGELYYTPELLQGFGLGGTVGLGGFPNGDAQKSAFSYPHYSTSRLLVRQTVGFGGEQETLDSAPNQVSENVDVSRLTFQAGLFPVADLFDGNAYARDSRSGFMNWAIWAAGAFDYAADRVGLGYGATAELNQKNWALRTGYFLMDAQSNSSNFDMQWFRRGEYLVELETRYDLFSHPGKLRTIGWINSGFMGSYRETLDNPALNLDLAQTRRGRIKYGYVFNLEQSVTDSVGLFGRWSWNDGKTEIMSFADIDASLSGGVSIKGTSWGRSDDTIGIAGAVNALSADHRDFTAAGGLGILIGDGRLSYRPEQILEIYYAYAISKASALTFDYQYIVNPAYNADRGPLSIFSGRIHAEF
jgi:high affinity Mn2+ porin